MGKIILDASNMDNTQVETMIMNAKSIANMLHRTVTVYTPTGNVEVEEDEEISQVQDKALERESTPHQLS